MLPSCNFVVHSLLLQNRMDNNADLNYFDTLKKSLYTREENKSPVAKHFIVIKNLILAGIAFLKQVFCFSISDSIIFNKL